MSAALPASWPCPQADGRIGDELAVVCGGSPSLLVVPALFAEGAKLRRFTLEVMRRLAAEGIGAVLPDLPGTNESLAPLHQQTPAGWRAAMAAAAAHFGTSHVLTIRGGALLAPAALPGWRYAATSGEGELRQLLRAHILTSREAGIEESREALLARGRAEGLELAGLRLSAAFIRPFETLLANDPSPQTAIAQETLGGGGLWLRAEAGEDAAQADALAAILAAGMRA